MVLATSEGLARLFRDSLDVQVPNRRESIGLGGGWCVISRIEGLQRLGPVGFGDGVSWEGLANLQGFGSFKLLEKCGRA